MVVQYPHTLQITVTAESHQDEKGNWVNGATTTITYVCRAEFLRGGGFIKNADGSSSDFNWLVYLPRTAGRIETGTKAVVMDGAVAIITGEVKRFLEGQMNARAWI